LKSGQFFHFHHQQHLISADAKAVFGVLIWRIAKAKSDALEMGAMVA